MKIQGKYIKVSGFQGISKNYYQLLKTTYSFSSLLSLYLNSEPIYKLAPFE